MHDQHNSPRQQPSKDYGAQDFLHLGEDLEQRERDRAPEPKSEGSWLLEGPEPSAEPPVTLDGSHLAPDSALPVPPPSEPAEGDGSGWLMEMNDQVVEAPEVPVPAGVPGAARRLEATYLEPESSGEVIGRSLYRSLLPAASIVLLTVAGIGAWKMMGSDSGGSGEPAPIEFRAPQRAEVLVSPNLDRRGPRGGGATPPNASARQPVESPSEPGELSIWPGGSEEELADPFELSEGPAVAFESESTLEALEELIATAPEETGVDETPSEMVPVDPGVDTTNEDPVAEAVEADPAESPVEQDPGESVAVVPDAMDPLAVVSPVNDPAVQDGPRRGALLPPAAWAMPVALSAWSSQAQLQSDPQEVVELVRPEAPTEDAPMDTVAVAEVVDVEESVEQDEVDPVDAWLESDGTVPFSALGGATEPDSVAAVEDAPALDSEGPLAVFAPTDEEVLASQPLDVESSAVVAEVTDEPVPTVDSPAVEVSDESWREHDQVDSSETGALDPTADPLTDEVACLEEPGADDPADIVESLDGEVVAALDSDEPTAEDDLTFEEALADVLRDKEKGLTQDDVEEPAETGAEGPVATVDVVEGEAVATVDGDEPTSEVDPQLADDLEGVTAVDSTEGVASADEPQVEDAVEESEGFDTLEVFDEMPEVDGLAEVELEDSTLDESPTQRVELPDYGPIAVLSELPEDEAVDSTEGLDGPAPEGLPALDDELVAETEVGVLEPWTGEDADLVATDEPEGDDVTADLPADDEPSVEQPTLEQPDVAVAEPTVVDDLEEGLSDDFDPRDEEAVVLAVLDEDPTQGVAPDDESVAVGPDQEVPEELVDAVGGDWFLGVSSHGPELPGSYVELDEESTSPSAGDDVAQGQDASQSRPKSSLLGTGNLLGTYGDFLRSGRVPQGASPDGDVAVVVTDPTPTVDETPEGDGTDVEDETASGLARAQSSRRWTSEEVPEHLFESEHRIYTPRVGDVRIELVGGDLLEGQLHSLGAGNIWVDTSVGRMQLQLARVSAVKRLGTVGKVADSDPDDRDYSNLPQVRVRTAGGVIVGRQLARDDESVTILTDDGIRMTLNSTDVTLANAKQSVIGVRPR